MENVLLESNLKMLKILTNLCHLEFSHDAKNTPKGLNANNIKVGELYGC